MAIYSDLALYLDLALYTNLALYSIFFIYVELRVLFYQILNPILEYSNLYVSHN